MHNSWGRFGAWTGQSKEKCIKIQLMTKPTKEYHSDTWPTAQNFFSINTREAQNWRFYMEERCDKELCDPVVFNPHVLKKGKKAARKSIWKDPYRLKFLRFKQILWTKGIPENKFKVITKTYPNLLITVLRDQKPELILGLGIGRLPQSSENQKYPWPWTKWI